MTRFLRSHTIQWLFGDECSAWEPGRDGEGARANHAGLESKAFFREHAARERE
jgi:hypothetical protein